MNKNTLSCKFLKKLHGLVNAQKSEEAKLSFTHKRFLPASSSENTQKYHTKKKKKTFTLQFLFMVFRVRQVKKTSLKTST